jgi:hypothetical protein
MTRSKAATEPSDRQGRLARTSALEAKQQQLFWPVWCTSTYSGVRPSISSDPFHVPAPGAFSSVHVRPPLASLLIEHASLALSHMRACDLWHVRTARRFMLSLTC